jgi:hypothetical protein
MFNSKMGEASSLNIDHRVPLRDCGELMRRRIVRPRKVRYRPVSESDVGQFRPVLASRGRLEYAGIHGTKGVLSSSLLPESTLIHHPPPSTHPHLVLP